MVNCFVNYWCHKTNLSTHNRAWEQPLICFTSETRHDNLLPIPSPKPSICYNASFLPRVTICLLGVTHTRCLHHSLIIPFFLHKPRAASSTFTFLHAITPARRPHSSHVHPYCPHIQPIPLAISFTSTIVSIHSLPDPTPSPLPFSLRVLLPCRATDPSQPCYKQGACHRYEPRPSP